MPHPQDPTKKMLILGGRLRENPLDLGDKVIREGLGDSSFHPVARLSVSVQKNGAIDLRGLCLKSPP